MRIAVIVKAVFVFELLWSAMSGLRAQDIVATLEAESGTPTLPAKVKYVSGYSGNAYVGDNDPGSAIVFRNVNIPVEGTYEFRTFYTSMFQRAISIQSGFYPPVISACKLTTADWNKPPVAEMVTYIYLNQGLNTITIKPVGDGGPNIDKFEILSTDVAMPRPTPVDVAFSYDLTDDAVIATNRTTDNLANVSDNAESTIYAYGNASADIKITCDMPYLLTGYFLSAGQGSTLDVRNWILEYSLNGTTYIPVSPTQTEIFPSGILFHIARNPHSDKAAATAHYRLKAYGGQIGEVQLLGIPYLPNTDNKNFPTDITQGLNIPTRTWGDPLGVSGSFDERFYNLFNRDMSKKYYWPGASAFWVDVEPENSTILNYYTLTSCQDYPERDPKSWVLQGYNTDWETISEVSDFTFPARYACMKFPVEIKKTYKGYRLNVTQNNGADAFQLLKWQLFGDVSSSIYDINDNHISVYASSEKITIRCEEIGSVRIANLSGQIIAHEKLNATENIIPIENGIYLVQVITNAQSKVVKVIVK